MEGFIIGIIVLVVVAGAFVYWKRSQQTKKIENAIVTKQNINLINSEQVNEEMNHLMIQLEQLSLDSIPDETKLMEITDSKVLAQVTNLIPELFKAGNAAGNAVQGAKANAEVLYRAIIPAGAKLANSREMDGAVRGIYHGAEGVKGHANLLAVKKNSNVSRNVAASAMNLASMVVGQYYMNEINEELGEISAGITKISEFQDNEYKSKVFALVAQIQKVAIFQVDILDNDELRLSEIYNLNRWEQECIQLLGQANLTIAGFGNKENLDYEEYEKQLAEAQNWFVYQKTLMEVMIKIAELKHTLHLGSASREQCGALLPTYSKQVQDSLNQLSTWHKTQTEKFEINVDEKSRKRMGLDGVIYFIPGLINEENKFCSIPNNTVKKIIAQTNGYTTRQNIDPIDLFQEDVRIIAKEGRIYYLPKDVL
ncbi:MULTISPECIES: hypothetical protein [Clostridium]|jgi:hypothetical protein|uniref:Uncharacterized protein n=3 Tax=Clostridium TaxID=1485 RepID=A0AAV3W4E2_9CLOT|nr:MULTISPECIES: hypothetical protein [Clostridium]ALB46537.1 hypothetical protein X276_15460 [Clostridium beijerinckii NRRL B-598]MBC2460365.1 hypothetical protein [Clostridium beijerinckii]MBC2477847.1 hypothetical protein [Clostridium beijerinckii]MCI1581082.1 hypothetical protein [Clostridium beijerinckii]MCI1585764.1 hypothetical protein [Clostridium beijerinckii]